MSDGKVTMADVARRAGVAATTVARVLYSNGYVAADKRLLVENTVREMGYRPNVIARGLRTNRSFALGMVINENPVNPFFVRMAQEIQVAALKEGLTVLTLNHNGNRETEKVGVQRFIDQRVDAIIFCSAVDPANINLAQQTGIPVVQVERQIARAGRVVLVDPRPGMDAAIAHLKSSGHRRVAFIGAKPGIDNSEMSRDQSTEAGRIDAFKDAMRRQGLTPDESLIHLGAYYSPELEGRPQGYILMQRILGAEVRPDAVVTGSDVLAAGALQAIYEKRLRVPDDISIIGFDDSFASFLTPPLTTIAQPLRQLGEEAIRLALDSSKDDVQQAATTFPTTLIVRASSRPSGSVQLPE